MPLTTYDGTQQTAAPSAVEIRAALKHILNDATFSHSPKLTIFLSYVVETTLEGHGDRLKAYTIALDGLGRGADFDSETDAIVRVHAIRTRRALQRYYASAGAEEAVIIDLPRRRYVPAFSRRTVPAALPFTAVTRPLAANMTTPTSRRFQTVRAWIEKRLRVRIRRNGLVANRTDAGGG
jgi:hypothetical protein